MSELPEGWAMVSLDEFGSWGSGGTPKRTNPAYYQNGTIPWLIIGDLNDNIVFDAATYITEEGLQNSSAKLLPVNTLLIAMYGSIGKLGITGIECATNQAIAYCIPDNKLTSLNFLFYSLMNAKANLVEEGKGGAQQNISQTILKAFKVPLPPLNEQKRIADKLEHLLSRIDACKERLEGVKGFLEGFRLSVLGAAVSGELTEPKTKWSKVKLESLLEDIRYGTSKKSSYDSEGLPVLRIPNIGNGYVDPSDLKYSRFTEKEVEKLALDENDLLIIRSNGSVELVGKVAIVEKKYKGYMYAGYLIRLRVDRERILPKYLSLYLSSPSMRKYIEITARSTSGVNNINSSEIQAIDVILPIIEEQKEIVRRVEHLFAFADRLEARYQEAMKRVERLTPAVLAKAFRGELVAQDPNDEPAAVLLERIRAARAAEPEKAKKKTVRRKPVKAKPARTLGELSEVLERLGGEALPDRLLTEVALEDDWSW